MNIHPTLLNNLRVMSCNCAVIIKLVELADSDPEFLKKIRGKDFDPEKEIDLLLEETIQLSYPTLYSMLKKWQDERKVNPRWL